jgi:4-carboxymuconolactone decarboxylase
MNSSAESSPGPKLPKTFRAFVTKFPEIGAAHESVARAVEKAGPLDRKTCELVKIGIAMGAGLESAVKSHVRRALENGATTAELEQAVLLGVNTRGFPAAVAAWQWVWDQINRNQNERDDNG